MRVLFSPMHMSNRPSSHLRSVTCQTLAVFPKNSFPWVKGGGCFYEPLDDLSTSELEAEGRASVVAWSSQALVSSWSSRGEALRPARDSRLKNVLASNLFPFSRVPL